MANLKALLRIIDGTETDSRKRAIKHLTGLGFSETEAKTFISYLHEVIPNLKGIVRKFYAGLIRWIVEDDLDIENPLDMTRVNTLLGILANHPAFDFYDKNFNGESFGQVRNKVELSDDIYHKPTNTCYEQVKISTFEEAANYLKYAPDWCILSSEKAFNEHTFNGINKFYFLLRSDYKQVPKSPGESYPYDDYGYSMIAVCIDPDGNLASCTSRWNFDESHDNFLKLAELKDLGFKL